MAYDEAGDTDFTINQPTITGKPPFAIINCIAYNGKYWIAGGQEVVREVGISTYSITNSLELAAFRSDDNLTEELSNLPFRKRGVDDYPESTYYLTIYNRCKNDIARYTTEKQLYTSQALATYNKNKELNYIPSFFYRKFVHTLAISTNGYNWTLVGNPFSVSKLYNEPHDNTSSRANAIAWNGSKWLVVGKTKKGYSQNGQERIFYIPSGALYSLDGKTWVPCGIAFETEPNCVACSSTKWIIGSKKLTMSTDLSNWTETANTFSTDFTYYYGIAYNGALWVAVGVYMSSTTITASIITSSDDGVTWNPRVSTTDSNNTSRKFKAVAWNGNSWIAIGESNSSSNERAGIIAKSEDGITWTVEAGNFPHELTSIVWNGNEWIIGGLSSNLYISSDGTNWRQPISNSYGVRAISTEIVLPILGGTLYTVSSLLVGFGPTSSILRSYGTNWIPQLLNGAETNYIGSPEKEFYGVVWNGTYWIIVGEKKGYSLQNIAISQNGIDWLFPRNGFGSGRAVATNDTSIIAVGEGIVSSMRIARSTDAINWTSPSCTLAACKCIGWNGTRWVIGGDGGIITSTDGTTWTPAIVCPLTNVSGVAWNGYYWVAVGSGNNHCIALSVDSERWYIANPNTIPFTVNGNAIAWNKTKWVAFGKGKNTIATSLDGYTWVEKGSDVLLSSGTAIAWDGSKWIGSGYSKYPVCSSVDGDTWSVYDVNLTRGNCFANKTISLPYTGTSSNTVLQKINTILNMLTNSTSATLVYEQQQQNLLNDAIAAAAALALRNASKSTADGHLNTVSSWKQSVNTQFTPLTVKTYGDLSKVYPDLYLIASGFNEYLGIVFDSLTSLKNRVYDDSHPQSLLDTTITLMLEYVNKVNSGFVTFYDTIRQLYSNLTTLTFNSITTNSFTSIINNYGYSTQRKNDILSFYDTKLSAFTTLKNTALSNFSSSITTVNSNSLPNLKQYYTNILAYDINTVHNSGYISNDSNPYYFLLLLPTTYSKINVYKTQAEAYIQQSKDDAIKWATVLEVSPPSLESIDNAFNSLFVELYNPASLNLDFLPFTTQQQLSILSSDFPVRKYKILADSYKHPFSYPSALQTLHDELKDVIDSVTTSSNAAINYANTKIDTTIKTKLADIKSITKTSYTLPLSTKAHLNNLLTKLYYSNSDYKDCVKYLNFLKSGYLLYPTLKQKLLDIQNADLNAEADGAKPPLTGWGGIVNLSGNITSVTVLTNFRTKIFTSSDISKLSIGYSISFYKSGSPIIYYRNKKTFLIDEIGSNFFVLNPKESILGDVTPAEYSWDFQLRGVDLGKFGTTWTLFNETYYARERLQAYISLNGINYGSLYTFKNPGILQGQGVPWKDFLKFTNTVTHNEIRDKIDNLNNKINEVINGFSETYIDSLVSNDVAAIQSKYVEFAESYIDNLKIDISGLLPDSDILELFGDKLVTETTTLQNAATQITADYNFLVNELGNVSLTGKTNSEIQTIVNSAISTKNQLTSILYGATYKSILSNARNYITQYASAETFINKLKNNVDRWVDHIKPEVLLSAPFDIYPISNGTGNPFIMSIVPTDADYWKQITHNTFTILSTGQTTTTLPPAVNPSDYRVYSNSTGYIKGDIVRYNNKAYRCILDKTPDFLSTDTEGIKNIEPIDTKSWKLRKYPYVVNTNNVQIEGTPENLTKLIPSNFQRYNSTVKYIKEDYVSYDNKVYRCKEVINTLSQIKGIYPSNTDYWNTISYPIVVYNGQNVEASPTNLPALTSSNILTYNSNQLYRDGERIKYVGAFTDPVSNTNYTGTTILEFNIDEYGTSIKGVPPVYSYNNTDYIRTDIWNMIDSNLSGYFYSDTNSYRVGDFVDYYYNGQQTKFQLISIYSRGNAPTVGSRNYSPFIDISGTTILRSVNWKVRTYPTVFYNFQKVEALPGTIPAYTAQNVTAYSENSTYNNGDIVYYQNQAYKCSVKYPGSLYNVPVSNTNFWQQTIYPYISYLSNYVEAVPGTIEPLSEYDFELYSSTKIYYIGDIVTYNGGIYECVGNFNYIVPIRNTLPTSTIFWEELVYPLVRVLGKVEQANPSLPIFAQLNEKKYHVYDNNWLYNVSDRVSYNGNVYECFNCTPPSRQNGAAPDIPFLTNIAPPSPQYWELTEIDYIKLNITDWDIKINYIIGTKILYNGYFYICETAHKSSVLNTPELSSYHWRIVADLTDIGLPGYYDSTANYSSDDKVTVRINQPTNYADISYTTVHYTCINTDPNEPIPYTYDKFILLGTKDASGNSLVGKYLGSWNSKDVRRFGKPNDDPFKIEGFCGALRRKVAMEVEMPYNGAASILNYNPNRYPTSRMFPNLYQAVLKPTNHSSRVQILETNLSNSFTKFINSEGVVSIGMLYNEIYYLLIYQANKRREKVQQLNEQVNVLKMQYFYNPSTQTKIIQDPYSYISVVGLAQDPPQRLFSDLGVGDLEQIDYDVNTAKTGKYNQSDYDACKENTDKLNALIEQISVLTAEMKLMVGYGLYFFISSSKTKAGGAIVCNSGTIYLPIGDYDTYDVFITNGVGSSDGLWYALNQLIDRSATPPEYTLPSSTATASLQVLTYEEQNDFCKGLVSVSRGLVGILGSAFIGSAGVLNGIIGLVGEISLKVDNIGKSESQEETNNSLLAMSQVGFQFNQNSNSIGTLLDSLDNYYTAQTSTPVEETTDELITLIGIALQLYGQNQRDINDATKYVFEEKNYKFSLERVTTTPAALPDAPTNPTPPTRRSPVYKGPSDDLIRSLRAEESTLSDLITDLRGKINQKLNLEPEIPIKSPSSVPECYRERVIKQMNVQIEAGTPTTFKTETVIDQAFEDRAKKLRELLTQRNNLQPTQSDFASRTRVINSEIEKLKAELGNISLDAQARRGKTIVTVVEGKDPIIKRTNKVFIKFDQRIANSQADRIKNQISKKELEDVISRNDARVQTRKALISQLATTEDDAVRIRQQLSDLELQRQNALLELDSDVTAANEEFGRASDRYAQDLADYEECHVKRELLRDLNGKLELQKRRIGINNSQEFDRVNQLLSAENVKVTNLDVKVTNSRINVDLKYNVLTKKITDSSRFRASLINLIPDNIKSSYNSINEMFTDLFDKTKLNVTSGLKAWRTYAYKVTDVHINKFTFKWLVIDGGVFKIFKRPGLALATGLVELMARTVVKTGSKIGGGSFLGGVGRALEVVGAVMGAIEAGAFDDVVTIGYDNNRNRLRNT